MALVCTGAGLVVGGGDERCECVGVSVLIASRAGRGICEDDGGSVEEECRSDGEWYLVSVAIAWLTVV